MEQRKYSRGNKKSFQVLLDPHRAELLNEIASADNQKATSLLRETAYNLIESRVTPEAYAQAKNQDEALWTKAVSTRTQSCMENRKLLEERYASE